MLLKEMIKLVPILILEFPSVEKDLKFKEILANLIARPDSDSKVTHDHLVTYKFSYAVRTALHQIVSEKLVSFLNKLVEKSKKMLQVSLQTISCIFNCFCLFKQ